MEAIFKTKRIGIWGFGRVGKSALSFISSFDCSLFVYDSRTLSKTEIKLVKLNKATLVPADYLEQFLEVCDFIIPSPGVNLHPYQDHQHKFISELDIFAYYITKPVVAITGSVGKTSTVHMLTHLCNALDKKTVAAGNIGLPLLEALAFQDSYDLFILELSSFQLQYTKQFAPEYAALINCYPNHLDHHESFDEYRTAKGMLFAHQKSYQTAVLPIEFYDLFWEYLQRQKVVTFADTLEQDRIKGLHDILPEKNWQIILTLLNLIFKLYDEAVIHKASFTCPALQHRMEPLQTADGIKVYNDSKSTLANATLQAVSSHPQSLLFLGGTSKGIDRIDLVKALSGKVKHIFCFGKEAHLLGQLCQNNALSYSEHTTLEEACTHCLKEATQDDTILFSPAGASFDLFKNYEERGKRFKQLITRKT